MYCELTRYEFMHYVARVSRFVHSLTEEALYLHALQAANATRHIVVHVLSYSVVQLFRFMGMV